MNRTRWNDDLETWCDERYYRKDEVDEMISRLELNSGLVFSVEVDSEIFSVGDGVQEFRANLSYANGTGVDGKNVLFSLVDGNGNSVDTSLVVTDVDGFAVYEYTPTGIGNVFVTASYGTLLQETFVIIDAMFYDSGASATKNTNFTKGSALTVTPSTDSTTFSSSSSTVNTGRYVANTGLTGDFIVEFKMKGTYGVRFGLTNATANFNTASNQYMLSSEYSEFRDWKITCIDGVITAYIYHNNQWETLTATTSSADTSSTLYFGFTINTSGTTYTGEYKDLKIYSI